MLHDSPFELAGRDAGRIGVCPVALLDAFFTNHWDFDSLCAGFSCGKCIATPEDMGLGGPCEADEPAIRFNVKEDWEVPF